MNVNRKLDFDGIKIHEMNDMQLYAKIEDAIRKIIKISITYLTIDNFNLVYSNIAYRSLFNSFGLIHPDGIGIFIASKLLYGKNGFKNRFTGSDFYPYLIQESITKNFSIFFFGDTIDTLNKVKINYPELNIVGTNEGFNYKTDLLIEKINLLHPDIVVIGLGSPNQEKWIIEYKDKIDAKVFLAVGDGIKVFAGTKVRGPIIVRKLGLEWLVRLINNPKDYWKRYIVGIPLFFYRIVKFKFSKDF